MKKLLALSLGALMMIGCVEKGSEVPQLNANNVDEVLAAMTLEEKALLTIGTGMAGFTANSATVGATEQIVPGAAGTTHAIERLGIPAIVLADGPAGLRITPIRHNDPENTYYCTGFPVGTLLASTWNSQLVEEVGKAMGNEVKEYGVDVLLAPALNLHRNPLCGRNFEYYSEDPYLAGKITSAMTKGVQSNGVGVSLKHFAVNNQEINRRGVNAVLTPRALRELYLRGFQIAVEESDPWTIMSSYNYINGVYASQSRDLLRTIARDEWGFRGAVMTDWGGGDNAAAQMWAGNDLLMPGVYSQAEDIMKAVNEGTLAVEDLDFCVKNILNLIVRTPRFAGYEYSDKPDLKAHAEVTRESAAEGMVLLKNENNTLPLCPTIKNVALFGNTSYKFIAGGTGSGDVNKAYVVDLQEGLKNAGYNIDAKVSKYYADYAAEEMRKAEAKVDKSNPFWRFMVQPNIEDKKLPASIVKAAAKGADVAILTIGRNSGEGADRAVEGDFNLTAGEKALIAQLKAAFEAEGKKLVVVLNIGGAIETASWKCTPDAILLAWQAGQEGGNTVADVLGGKVNPSGRLPMTFPVNYMDHASSNNFPWHFEVKPEDRFALFMGAVQPGAEGPRKDIEYCLYEEDVYVGYRYFDTFEKEVSYPFGYGLSYTTFEYANAELKERKGVYTLTVDVTNTGAVAGKEVVELYVASPAIEAGRPAQELAAFAKTSLLEPGQTEKVTLTFDRHSLAWYNTCESAWMMEKGNYVAKVSASSRDAKLEVPFTVKKTKVVEKTHDVMHPNMELNTLKAN